MLSFECRRYKYRLAYLITHLCNLSRIEIEFFLVDKMANRSDFLL